MLQIFQERIFSIFGDEDVNSKYSSPLEYLYSKSCMNCLKLMKRSVSTHYFVEEEKEEKEMEENEKIEEIESQKVENLTLKFHSKFIIASDLCLLALSIPQNEMINYWESYDNLMRNFELSFSDDLDMVVREVNESLSLLNEFINRLLQFITIFAKFSNDHQIILDQVYNNLLFPFFEKRVQLSFKRI